MNTNMIKLISYTRPSDEFIKENKDILNLQELVAYCARVSNPNNQNNTKTSEKLIKYLVKHAHWSPLEMVNIVLEINTTRDIAHQIIRHRSFSYQEFSQRYSSANELSVDLEAGSLGPFRLSECRLQDLKNRQNSVDIGEEDKALAEWWDSAQKDVIRISHDRYIEALSRGIAKEQARKILPEGLTMTRIYMNGSLRSWIHYIDVRAGNGTQKEHSEIARLCAETISKVFPLMKDF